MIIEYDKGLKTQSFYEKGKFISPNLNEEKYFLLGEVKDPVLAYDRVKLSKLEDCRAEIIANSFGSSPETVFSKYENTFNAWYKLPGTWPATIDTMIFLDKIADNEKLKNSNNVLDLACGTGMVGHYVANSNDISFMTFSDINPNAVKSSELNSRMSNKRDINFSYNVGDAFANVDEKYDVILASALPSTPAYPGLTRELNPLFEGVNLLEKILQEAPNHLNRDGKLIMSSFSVGDFVVDDLMKKYGAKVKPLGEKEIPFRVEFLGDQSWVDYLVEKGGMEFKKGEGHPYWHKCKVSEVSFE